MPEPTNESRAGGARAREPEGSLPARDRLPSAAREIVTVCNALGIRFSAAEIKSWFSIDFSSLFEPEPRGKLAWGDAHLGNLIASMRSQLGVGRVGESREKSAARHQVVIDALTSQIGARRTCWYETQFPHLRDEGFRTRRTPMNTSLDREVIGNAPIVRYLSEHPQKQPATIIDFGVGYPPLTTAQTARLFQGRANVLGVDISIPDVIVKSPLGDGHLLAFYERSAAGDCFLPTNLILATGESWNILQYSVLVGTERELHLRRSDVIRRRLMRPLGEQLHLRIAEEARGATGPALQGLIQQAQRVSGRDELLVQPMRAFDSGARNVRYVTGDLSFEGLPRASFMRIANVFHYYSAKEIQKALTSASRVLEERGQLLVVTHEDHAITFEKRRGALVPIRCTARLLSQHMISYPAKKFPGLQEQLHALLAAGGATNSSQRMGSPLSEADANRSVRRLRELGYNGHLTRYGNELLLNLELE